MMKNTLIYILGILIVLSLLVGCERGTENGVSFIGVVLENRQDYLLVEPVEGSGELASADKIVVFIGENTQLSIKGKTNAIAAEDIGAGSRVEIFYSGAIAESYPAQINSSHKIVLLEGYVFTASDENFLVKTYIEKLQFKEAEEISLYSTIEYIGEKDSIDIWSGEPYFHHIIYKNGEVFSGDFTLNILKKTELKKGEIYTIPFSKSGGFSEDDPDADFWREFYSEKTLRLPNGEYTFSAITSFTLDKEQQEKVQLKTEFTVEVN
ncbi:hypothetical protein [Sinanaerobacter chloroacetimidivorans]|uniref:Lipoprotein n=1 Tax=Sinanaerobacter chloroacetimidivorans TaxID=2818044 RepID=A0A8J7W6L4_9FIRM|nr:hypothetical protein [Sinanaerobacter chloroacetimidivorans]MBR0600283.1 hypothetical protein [Sinanaerobacter chloroacetimidivorans]